MRAPIDNAWNRTASFAIAPLTCLCAVALLAAPAGSHPPDDTHTHIKQQHSGTEHGSLAEVGAKLSDPTANIWALQFNIQAPTFYDGDVNTGDPEDSAPNH
jgi:hypothetical protein